MPKTKIEKFGQQCTTGKNHGLMAGGMASIDEHYVFEFENGWGASVIIGGVSFGSWELAVMRGGRINYDHPVSRGDVVRGSEEEITAWLELIKTTPADADLETLKGLGV